MHTEDNGHLGSRTNLDGFLRSRIHSGTEHPELTMTLAMPFRLIESDSVKNVIARPSLPALPVRPERPIKSQLNHHH